MLFPKIPTEQKRQMISNIQMYFKKERDEIIGDLAADNLLDFFIKELSPNIYNQALSDVRTVLAQKMMSMEEEIYALEIPLQTRSR